MSQKTGFNATKAMARSLATKDPPKVEVDWDQPPRYDPNTHTVYVPGFVMDDMPRDLRTMYRAYLDHETAEPEVSEWGPKVVRRYGGQQHVPDMLSKTINAINDGLRVDAWQGQRFPGAHMNIQAQVRQDLEELRQAYRSQPRRLSPERAGIAFMATLSRYIADGVITVREAKQEFGRFRDMIEQVEDDLLWIEDNVDHDDPASSKLEDDVIHHAERIYYRLRDVEPPSPQATQQECQQKAQEARQDAEQRQQGQGQQGDAEGGQQGQQGNAGSGQQGGQSQGQQSGSGSSGDETSQDDEADNGDSSSGESKDSTEEEADKDGDSGGESGQSEGEDESSTSSDQGEESADQHDTQHQQYAGDEDQRSDEAGGSSQDTVVEEKIHPEGDFDWNPEDNLADKIKQATDELAMDGSTYVEYEDPQKNLRQDREGDFQPAPDHEERARQHMSDYRQYGGTLATRIRQAMFTPGPVKVDRQRRGNLDQRRVHSLATGERNAFKKTMPRDRQDVAVSLAVDESGSMRNKGKRDCAADLAMTWGEACERLDAPLEVMGWRTRGFRILKPFDASFRDKTVRQSVASLTTGGGTPMASAIFVAAERLANRPEDQKILFCLTDGAYTGTDMKSTLQMCKRHGITVVFIGAGVGNPWGGTYEDLYDGWVTVHNPKHLALTASKKLVKMIRKGRG